MIDICQGLQFIHDLDEVHRDLKPWNNMYYRNSWANNKVLYSARTNHWKLADFGFTSNCPSTVSALSEHRRGTEGYRAPELLKTQDVAYSTVSETKCF